MTCYDCPQDLKPSFRKENENKFVYEGGLQVSRAVITSHKKVSVKKISLSNTFLNFLF